MKRMMTVIAVAIVALVGALNAQAQGGFRWGVMGGANFSKFSTKTEDLKSNLFTGFHVGPVVEYELPVFPIAIEAGLLYSQKGMELTDGKINKDDAFTLRSNIIEIPVNLKAYVFSIPAARFFVIAGPSFNFALNTKVGDIKLDKLADIKANKTGISINAGIGAEVAKIIQISATFNVAMNDSYKFEDAAKVVNEYLNTKEKGFSITARVLF